MARWQKYTFDPDWRAKMHAIIARAVAEGRHGPGAGEICAQCRRDVPHNFHVEMDGRRICEACYTKNNAPLSSARQIIPALPVKDEW